MTDTPHTISPFDTASPLDARYYLADRDFFRRLHPYTSEGRGAEASASSSSYMPAR